MDAFEDDDYVSASGSTSSSFLGDDDSEFLSPNAVDYLSNVDYSLNSPLISDEIEEFMKFLRGHSYRKSWNMTTWRYRKEVINHYHDTKSNLIHPADFHKWFGRKNLSNNAHCTEFQKLLDEAQKDSDDTYPIVAAFFKGWLNKTIHNVRKNVIPNQILKWGSYFLDFHIATLLLKKFPDVAIFRSENFGRIVIVRGFAFFVDERILMDRNTLLMCKDTYIARFQTLFSMVNRTDKEFDRNDWYALSNIYKLGDQMLQSVSGLAYDALKMVESICSLRMAELARVYRPLIPEFPDYRHHINKTVDELSQDNLYIKELFAAIMKLQTPEIVLTVFGSFRHWGHPYLQYLAGLRALNNQVTMEKDIDSEYAGKLASDLAYMVLKSKFTEVKTWYVDRDALKPDHPLREHILNNTWPTPKQISDFGDRWHELPLTKCFEIPDMLDPSMIYSDRSHHHCNGQWLE